jgi:hypothetical protein
MRVPQPKWLRRECERQARRTCSKGSNCTSVLDVPPRLNFYFSYRQVFDACSVKPAGSRIFHPRRSPGSADCALLALRDGRDGRTKFPLRRWDSSRPVSTFLPRKSPDFDFVFPHSLLKLLCRRASAQVLIDQSKRRGSRSGLRFYVN